MSVFLTALLLFGFAFNACSFENLVQRSLSEASVSSCSFIFPCSLALSPVNSQCLPSCLTLSPSKGVCRTWTHFSQGNLARGLFYITPCGMSTLLIWDTPELADKTQWSNRTLYISQSNLRGAFEHVQYQLDILMQSECACVVCCCDLLDFHWLQFPFRHIHFHPSKLFLFIISFLFFIITTTITVREFSVLACHI